MRRRDLLKCAAIPVASLLLKTAAQATPKQTAPKGVLNFRDAVGFQMPNHPPQVIPDRSKGMYHAWFSKQNSQNGKFNLYPNWQGDLVPITGVARSYTEGIEGYRWNDMVYLGLVKQHYLALWGGYCQNNTSRSCLELHALPRRTEVVIFDPFSGRIMRICKVNLNHIPEECRDWIRSTTSRYARATRRTRFNLELDMQWISDD